jgi:hypothetical protein
MNCKAASLQTLVLATALSLVAALSACSSSSPGSATPPTIKLSSTPSSLATGGTLQITATITNDSSGANWSASCGSTSASACGTFGSANTASGTAVTYTAPATIPPAAVVITATVADDSSVSASTAAITITATTSITVTLNSPPTAVMTGSPATLAATTNDPTGVKWSCTPTPACGGFSPGQTATGVTTTFTAGVTTGNIIITATAVTDTTQSASATVTITPGTALADGKYVFYLSGEDTFTSGYYFVSGTITVSGGAIASGEQDFVDSANYALSDLINPTGSTIGTFSNGNLQIVLTTCDGTNCASTDTNLGVSGVETLNGSLFSATGGLITEFDTSATSTGTLDFQNPTAAATTPSGGYAFTVEGYDNSGFDLALGGILNVDGPGTISGTGSLYDANDSGTLYAAQTFAVSTVSAPDSFGRVIFTLNPTSNFAQISMVGYIVDSTHIRLVETTDAALGTTGGMAFGQSGSPSSVVGNTYVLGMAGTDPNGFLQAATLLTTNSDGSVSGSINYNDLTGTGTQSPIAIQSGATYTASNSVPGYVSISGVTDGVNIYNIQLYLDGNGNALALTLDGGDEMSGRGAQQTSGSFTASSFDGAYAMQVAGWDYNETGEFSAVGTAIADGVGTFAGTNDVDLNWLFNTLLPGITVNGTFSANAAGAFTGTITGLDLIYNTDQDAFSYYPISPTSLIVIETDPNQLTLDQFRLQ